MQSQIEHIKKKEKLDSELSVFWSKFSSFLPKSIEREAFGDEKIFLAFKQVYPYIINYIKENTQVEHCSEPNCPECNLAAYNKGKEDVYEDLKMNIELMPKPTRLDEIEPFTRAVLSLLEIKDK